MLRIGLLALLLGVEQQADPLLLGKAMRHKSIKVQKVSAISVA